MQSLEYCLGFHAETITLNKGNSGETQVNVKQTLYEPLVSTANDAIEWFAEPHFEDGPVKGTFRHVHCVRVAYSGTFKNGT